LGAGAQPRQASGPTSGPTIGLGDAFVRCLRHFWPDLNQWIGELPDSRFEPFVTYDKKFLIYLALGLYWFRLGARRKLDYELGADARQKAAMLANVNRLAGARQNSLPVHRTVDHYLSEHLGWEPLARWRTQMVRRLLRMKVLDSARLFGHVVVAVDGTGHLAFGRRHCEHCLVQTQGGRSYYYHQVVEAKVIGPSGLALSVGTEFIDNSVVGPRPSGQGAETWKQDCELKGFQRLAPRLKKDLPQTRLCITGDSLYACGPVMSLCEQKGWRFVLTFKEGRTPELWREFQALKALCPKQVVRVDLPDGTREEYRWVNGLVYEDSSGQEHQVSAIECVTWRDGEEASQWAWLTDFEVTAERVVAIATRGGRPRSKIEKKASTSRRTAVTVWSMPTATAKSACVCFTCCCRLRT